MGLYEKVWDVLADLFESKEQEKLRHEREAERIKNDHLNMMKDIFSKPPSFEEWLKEAREQRGK